MRRLPALIAFIVGILAIGIVARGAPTPRDPVFAVVPVAWMPSAPPESGASDVVTTWFCPGVPVPGDDGIGGQILIGNRSSSPVNARVQWLGPVDTSAGSDGAGESGSAVAEAPVEQLVVEPHMVALLDVGLRRRGEFVAAVVEVDGPAIVEQRIVHPSGSPVTPCADSTSATWFVAEGFTAAGSSNEIVLTNPFDDVVIVDLVFATDDGPRVPAAYQGIPLAPRSVQVIDLGAPGAGAQEEPSLAVRVEATRGELVLGRAQRFAGGGRSGYAMTLGAPALRDQWWFVNGDKGPGITTQYSIYNATTADVEVDVIFLGISDLADVEPITVPARRVVVFDPAGVDNLADGRHSVVFSTRSAPSIVVERVSTRTDGGQSSTSVLLGAPPRFDGFVANRWHLVSVPSSSAPASMVMYNVDNVAATVSVEAVGPDGLVPVPGLVDIALPAAAILTVDIGGLGELTGRELVVTSTTRVFVERSLPSGSGRSSAWAVPAE
jgi:hypothetical protein